jgi:hypothetical protein
MKLLMKLLLLTIILVVVANHYWPETLVKKSQQLFKAIGLSPKQQVLGLQAINTLGSSVQESTNWIAGQPWMQKVYEQVSDRVENQWQETVEKPKKELEGVKSGVRDTVCGQWLKE